MPELRAGLRAGLVALPEAAARHACERCCRARRCLGNTRPRQFGPGPAGVLANLTELIVHEVEAAAGRALQRQQSERLLAVMDLYQAPHLLVDTGAHRWRVVHLNARGVEAAGAPRAGRACACPHAAAWAPCAQ